MALRPVCSIFQHTSPYFDYSEQRFCHIEMLQHLAKPNTSIQKKEIQLYPSMKSHTTKYTDVEALFKSHGYNLKIFAKLTWVNSLAQPCLQLPVMSRNETNVQQNDQHYSYCKISTTPGATPVECRCWNGQETAKLSITKWSQRIMCKAWSRYIIVICWTQ